MATEFNKLPKRRQATVQAYSTEQEKKDIIMTSYPSDGNLFMQPHSSIANKLGSGSLKFILFHLNGIVPIGISTKMYDYWHELAWASKSWDGLSKGNWKKSGQNAVSEKSVGIDDIIVQGHWGKWSHYKKGPNFSKESTPQNPEVVKMMDKMLELFCQEIIPQVSGAIEQYKPGMISKLKVLSYFM